MLTRCEKQAGFLLIWSSTREMFLLWLLCPVFLLHQSGNKTSVMISLLREHGCNVVNGSCSDQILMIELCREPPVGLLRSLPLSNYTGWKLIFFSASHLEESQPLAITAVYLTVKSISLMNWSPRRGTCWFSEQWLLFGELYFTLSGTFLAFLPVLLIKRHTRGQGERADVK